ncbi:hypothetical protein K0651_03615 [Ornithinimicrobium sp. Arc0846-15]|nr:hypothetical protein [Ornithinimicrobium laminariae]
MQKYQDIVRIAAEAEWKQEHPNEDVPSDLWNSVSLTIDRIDEGSADIFLAFEQHQTYVEYQLEAQDVADSVLVAAYSGTEIPDLPSLSEEKSYAFRSTVAEIGSTLKPGQTIEYYPDAPGSSPITISIETRDEAVGALLTPEDFLLAPSSELDTFALQKSDESLVGKITALDTDRMTYRFTLQGGQQLTGHYKSSPELLDDLRKVVNDAAEGPLTRVTGELQTKNDELFRFWQTTSVEQVQFDDTEWGHRLATFTALRPDWDGAGAEQISPVALDAAQTVLRAITEADIERPGVFPTPEGGILLEWGSSQRVVSVEFLEDGSFETFSLTAGEPRGEHSFGDNLAFAVEFVKAVRA